MNKETSDLIYMLEERLKYIENKIYSIKMSSYTKISDRVYSKKIEISYGENAFSHYIILRLFTQDEFCYRVVYENWAEDAFHDRDTIKDSFINVNILYMNEFISKLIKKQLEK